MNKPKISAIAAIGANRELGKKNGLIWRIPADLKRLKKLTLGKTIIMGRKTYESIGRPLPQRRNIVVSQNPDFVAPGCEVVSSIEEALSAAENEDEVFIFGGAAIYKAAMPFIQTLYLTHIDATDPEADTFFPDFSDDFVATTKHSPLEYNKLQFQWVDFKRKS